MATTCWMRCGGTPSLITYSYILASIKREYSESPYPVHTEPTEGLDDVTKGKVPKSKSITNTENGGKNLLANNIIKLLHLLQNTQAKPKTENKLQFINEISVTGCVGSLHEDVFSFLKGVVAVLDGVGDHWQQLSPHFPIVRDLLLHVHLQLRISRLKLKD